MNNTNNKIQFDGFNFEACIKQLDSGGIISAGNKPGLDNYYLILIEHFKKVFDYKPVWDCRQDSTEVIINKKK